jgi:methionine synthase II (cobalamin-independent)
MHEGFRRLQPKEIVTARSNGEPGPPPQKRRHAEVQRSPWLNYVRRSAHSKDRTCIMELPFHGEHIGSLLRPTALQKAQARAAANEISPNELLQAEHDAISYIVSRQLELGIRSISSGEYDRCVYFGGFFEKLEGFKEVTDPPWDLYRLSAPPIAVLKKAGLKFPMTVVCTGKIRYAKSPYLEQWKYLRSCVPRELWGNCKFTMPPAPFFHLRLAPGKVYSKDAYTNDEDFFADLAAAYQKEFKTLHDEGLRNIQIDDPTLAYFCSQEMLEGLRKDGVDPDKLFDQYLKAHNDCLKGRPKSLQVGLHICRGKSAS